MTPPPAAWTSLDEQILRAATTAPADDTPHCVCIYPHTLGTFLDGIWEPLDARIDAAATRCLAATTLATVHGMALVAGPLWLVNFFCEHTSNASRVVPAPPDATLTTLAALWRWRAYPYCLDLDTLVDVAARVYRRPAVVLEQTRQGRCTR